jgi:hypothetical protein
MRKEVNRCPAHPTASSRGRALAAPTRFDAFTADPLFLTPHVRTSSTPKEWTTAMITAFPAASAQVPPGGLARADRSANMLLAPRKLPAASPPT